MNTTSTLGLVLPPHTTDNTVSDVAYDLRIDILTDVCGTTDGCAAHRCLVRGYKCVLFPIVF